MRGKTNEEEANLSQGHSACCDTKRKRMKILKEYQGRRPSWKRTQFLERGVQSRSKEMG
jgi:hypothetical protein